MKSSKHVAEKQQAVAADKRVDAQRPNNQETHIHRQGEAQAAAVGTKGHLKSAATMSRQIVDSQEYILIY